MMRYTRNRIARVSSAAPRFVTSTPAELVLAFPCAICRKKPASDAQETNQGDAASDPLEQERCRVLPQVLVIEEGEQ